MADLSVSQQHLEVQSCEAAASSSADSAAASSTFNKKGKKTVGGLEFTPELQSIARSILELEVSPPTSVGNNNDDKNMFFDEDEGSPEDWVPTNMASTKNSRSSTVRRALTPMPREDAIAAIQSVLLEIKSNNSNKPTSLVPLSTIKAMSDLLKAYAMKYPQQSHTASTIRNQLEKALISSTLKFDVKVQEMSKEQLEEATKFEKRMQLLRIKAEEKKYHQLTENLEKPLDEEINVKSMTYAASIGLNMIVAPVSFGILAYFVSGMYFVSDAATTTTTSYTGSNNDANILHTYKVICAVIAGVLMMFIEMILFVIRSNEMEYYTSKKKKKNKNIYGPFGNKEAARVAQTREVATFTPFTITEAEN